MGYFHFYQNFPLIFTLFLCVHVYLKQMLMGQVVSGVEFKYEYMVNSCLPPSVRVNSWNTKKINQKTDRWLQVCHVIILMTDWADMGLTSYFMCHDIQPKSISACVSVGIFSCIMGT